DFPDALPILMPDEESEEHGDRGIEEHIPGIDQGHGTKGKRGQYYEQKAVPGSHHLPVGEGIYTQEEKEDLVEEGDNMGMEIAPYERERRIFVNGVRDRAGTIPEDSP